MNNIESTGNGMFEVWERSFFFVDESGNDFRRAFSEDGSPSASAESSKPRVLVVDDERLIADTCAQILENAGLEARIAYDGWSALEMLADFRPDYLLTDVLMPDMNGVQLAIAVKKMFPNANILLFSGQAGISDILLEGREQGHEFELIAKPLHPLKLLAHFNK